MFESRKTKGKIELKKTISYVLSFFANVIKSKQWITGLLIDTNVLFTKSYEILTKNIQIKNKNCCYNKIEC